MSNKRIPGILTGAILLAALMSPSMGCAKKITLTFGYPWSNPSDPDKMFKMAAKEYMRLNPDIVIKLQAGAWHDRLLTQMAGGVGPDVFVITNPNVAPDALAGVATPLGKYLKAAKLSAADFWEPTWRECLHNGEPYALPWESAPNFGLWLNNEAFREVGLPTRSPANFDEFNLFAQKLTKVDPSSKAVKRMGVVPWFVYGNSNALFTWSWCFGANFYDAKSKKLTLMDNGIVKALDWMKKVADLNGGAGKVNAVLKGDESTSFATGRIAMQPNGSWACSRIPVEAPKLEYDIVRMPVVEGINSDPTWIGGHKMILPRGGKHPQEAFNFLKFLSADPVGSDILSTYGNLPGYRKSPAYQRFSKDRDMGAYVKILEKAAHIRPEIPVSDLLASEMDAAVSRVLADRQTPEQAMAKAQNTVQSNLDRVMKRFESRGK